MFKLALRHTLTLLIICALCAFGVSAVRTLTKGTVSARQKEAIEASYRSVLPQAAQLRQLPTPSTPNLTALTVSEKGLIANGFIYITQGSGYGGEVVVMTGISHPAGLITGIKILKQNETPGLGAKCVEESFTKQFRGKDSTQSLLLSKKGSSTDIVAITSATITSQAVTRAVNIALEHYAHHFGG